MVTRPYTVRNFISVKLMERMFPRFIENDGNNGRTKAVETVGEAEVAI